MKYQKRGIGYRIADETMYQHVRRDELIEFTGKPGDVLFIDSSRCFHYGSRNAVVPRFMAMYGFTTTCRTDLSQTFYTENKYPLNDNVSRLRRLVLQPHS